MHKQMQRYHQLKEERQSAFEYAQALAQEHISFSRTPSAANADNRYIELIKQYGMDVLRAYSSAYASTYDNLSITEQAIINSNARAN
jgi:hypothetical protein